MKKVILSMALAIAAPFAWAQVSETTTTTTTTEGSEYDHRIQSGQHNRAKGKCRPETLPLRKDSHVCDKKR
jgi:hypothetical protein